MPSKRSDHELAITTKVKDLASKELRHVGEEGKKSGESIAAGFIKAQLAIGAMKAAVRGAVEFVRGMTTDVAKQGDEMAKLSRRLGVGIETLSAFGYAAQLGGSNVQEMGNALKFLQKNAYESTAEGGGLATAKRAFDALGISVKDSSGNLKDAETLFFEASDALSKLGAGMERTGIATQLFGRSGLTIIPIIDQGTAAIRAQIEEARRYGIVWTDTTGKIAEDFVDAQTRMNAAINGLKISIGTQLLPVLTEGLNDLANYIADNRDDVTDIVLDAVESVSSFIYSTMETLAVSFAQIADAVQSIVSLFSQTPEQRQISDLGSRIRERTLRASSLTGLPRLDIEANPDVLLGQGAEAERIRREILALNAQIDPLLAKLEEGLAESARRGFENFRKVASETWTNTRMDLALRQFFDFEEPARKGGQAAGQALAEGVAETLGDPSKLGEITREFQKQIALMLAPDDMARDLLKVRQALTDTLRNADLVGGTAEEVEALYRTLLEFKRLSEQGIIEEAFGSEFAKSVDEGRRAVEASTRQLEGYREAMRAAREEEDLRDSAKAQQEYDESFVGAISNSIEQMRPLTQQLGEQILPSLTSGLDTFFATIRDGSASAGEAFRAFGADILQTMQHIANQALAIEGLKAFFSLFGVNLPALNVGSLSAPKPMAEGGIVTKPTLSITGERGPEAVIPLSRMGDVLRGGGESTIVLNQTIVAPPGTDQKAFAKTVVDMALRGLRSSRGARQSMRRELGGTL